jgi:hypothetical protein
VVVGALEAAELNELVREWQARKVHIHLSNGVQRGINYRRLRAVPIVHEPLFSVESVSLDRRQILAKRALDIVEGHGGHHHSLTVAGTDRRGRSTWASEVQSTNERSGPLF